MPLGAWELPAELVALLDTVRRFMAQEVVPLEDTLEGATDIQRMVIARELLR